MFEIFSISFNTAQITPSGMHLLGHLSLVPKSLQPFFIFMVLIKLILIRNGTPNKMSVRSGVMLEFMFSRSFLLLDYLY